ncbi:MAG: family 16 glycosylhydrolase [Flavobacteriaceae bacterium]|nr:family 16 glycosylhydrolase [Flavobacteriaceae bacterium]
MIRSVFIISVLLSQSILLLNHIIDEVFGGNAVPSQTQNCAQDAENGDYRYEISSDLNNPTITFIPLNGDAGSTLCLLYYGVGTGPHPVNNINPNTPFQINASQGSQINFYFTYSYNGGERNNSNNPYSFVVGECASSDATDDATLSSISINNTPLSGFSAQTMSYTYSLPIGETNVPTVSVSTSNVNATYSINDISSIPGTTTITVVSEDTTQTKTYSIAFQQSSYALVWSDEFDDNGTTYISGVDNPIDDSKWFHQTKLPNGWGWYNNEQQHYTNRIENSYVSDGTLKIVAKKEVFSDQGHTKDYTSARLNSKFAFTYGVVEIRVKLPIGVGTWPAIWTLGKNINENGAYWQQQGFGSVSWPACGEIDIMEHWGSNQNFIQSAMHTPSSHGATVNHGGRSISTISSQFHVYKLEWTAEKMTFLVDDIEHYTYNPSVKNDDTWPFDNDQYILLNIAIESSVTASFTSSAMEIDYIRVYQEQPLSIDQNTPLQIQLYPNPALKRFFIDSTKDIDEVNIYDLNGRPVVQRRPMQKEISIVEDLSKGVYLVEIKGLDFQFTRRLIVQ